MLRFSDQPYRFFPPSYFAPTAWLIRRCNRHWLRTRLQVTHVDLAGGDRLRSLPANARLVLLANHPTHCDASIMLETCRQLGVRPRIMAAYDLYHRGRFDGWVLKRVGCFSVDREGSDKPALEEASRTIVQGSGFHLTMFPEGNVYLENDRVTPFHDGASFLAVRAAKQLAEAGVPVYCVPISIKATHLTDCRPQLRRVIASLAEDVGVAPDASGTPLEALRQIGIAAARRELARRGLPTPDTDHLPTLVREAADGVLRRLEPALQLTPAADAEPIHRVRAARRIIHEIRTDPARPADEQARAAGLADDAMLAFRLSSYSGDYVTERPSLDRIGETCEKLYEDLHERFLPPYAPRAAMVRINEPIDVAALASQYPKQKQAIAALTDAVEASVQRGVDAMNNDSRHEGGSLWSQPLGR